jgi:hypothetical protein
MRVDLRAFGWFPAVDRVRGVEGDDEEAGGEEVEE